MKKKKKKRKGLRFVNWEAKEKKRLKRKKIL